MLFLFTPFLHTLRLVTPETMTLFPIHPDTNPVRASRPYIFILFFALKKRIEKNRSNATSFSKDYDTFCDVYNFTATESSGTSSVRI